MATKRTKTFTYVISGILAIGLIACLFKYGPSWTSSETNTAKPANVPAAFSAPEKQQCGANLYIADCHNPQASELTACQADTSGTLCCPKSVHAKIVAGETVDTCDCKYLGPNEYCKS